MSCHDSARAILEKHLSDTGIITPTNVDLFLALIENVYQEGYSEGYWDGSYENEERE